MFRAALITCFALISLGCEEKSAVTESPPKLISCPPLAHRFHQNTVADAPIRQGPFDSHINREWRQGSELIEVRWLPVFFSIVMHEMLVYTDEDGQQRVIAGFPEDKFDIFFDFGTIIIQISRFEPDGDFSEDLAITSMRKVVARGDDLSALWNDMAEVATVIDELGVDYDLIGTNSNASSETILKYAGLPASAPDFLGDISSDIDLIAQALGSGNVACDNRNQKVQRIPR